MIRRPVPDPVDPGQESVWEYPRPPRVEVCEAEVVVVLAGEEIARSQRSLRVLETSHPPVHYIDPTAVRLDRLIRSRHRSVCEFKGIAEYWDAPGHPEIAWSYASPEPGYEVLRDHIAFYPGRCERVTLGGENVRQQGGGFYGGWITDAIVGPFKGEPGTWGW